MIAIHKKSWFEDQRRINQRFIPTFGTWYYGLDSTYKLRKNLRTNYLISNLIKVITKKIVNKPIRLLEIGCFVCLLLKTLAFATPDVYSQQESTKADVQNIQGYLHIVQEKIRANWKQPSVKKFTSAVIYFRILAAGQITDIRVSHKSDNTVLDSLAVTAVKNSAPFPMITVPYYKKYGLCMEMRFDFHLTDDELYTSEINKIILRAQQNLAKGNWQFAIASLNTARSKYNSSNKLKNELNHIWQKFDPGYCKEILAQAVVDIDSHMHILLEVFKKNRSEHENESDTTDHIAEAKLISGTSTISIIRFEPISSPLMAAGYYGYSVSGKFLGDKGFSEHPKLVSFHFEYQACDFPNGEIILFLKNNKLYYGLTASGSGNEQICASYHLIFPNDNKGRHNKLIVVHTFTDTETGRRTSADINDIYVWNSVEFKHIN